MSETACLAVLLDAPLQSWGFSSRFQRRTTGLYPTKSGVLGLICAAMGLAKGSPEEAEWLPKLSKLKMTSIAIPRRPHDPGDQLPVLRFEDYHTVLDTRRASGKRNEDAVVSRRQYLLDARFGIILAGYPSVLKPVAGALQDPVWGVWLGRKSCVPAEIIFRGIFGTRAGAERALIGGAPIAQFTRLEDVRSIEDGTDSYPDQPNSFGKPGSSAQGRSFSVRRVKLILGELRET